MMGEISEHCLCDNCSGQDCNIFTEEEKERDQKEHDAKVASEAVTKVLDELQKCVGQWIPFGSEPTAVMAREISEKIESLRRLS